LSKWIFNIFVIPLLNFISILPFWMLFGISNFFYLLVYYVIGYRKKVVYENLKKSFPEKTDQELTKIMKDFYLHFCDVIFETVKLLTISKKEFKKRCSINEESIKTFQYFFDKNQTFVGVMGHCGNWEWGAIAHQVYFTRMITGDYHPLSNKNFDTFMLNLRSRFGGNIVAMTQLYKRLITLKQQNISTTIGLIADQTPPPESAYWTTFLHQDTPVFNGTEKLAKKFNYPVVYLNIKKAKRGYYNLSTTVITENPKDLPDGEISELHTKHLENNILAQPYTWLWSHRRWKHKRPTS
jgi:Kdo2-lipid IVA lauroyltransferase/acyltransferase